MAVAVKAFVILAQWNKVSGFGLSLGNLAKPYPFSRNEKLDEEANKEGEHIP